MKDSSSIRTVIADDEPLARRGIRIWLESERDVKIVAEADNGTEAIERIGTLKPDLVFLDVQMPEANGFEVLEHVAGIHMPLTIFVTAYDLYAIRAFEVHAVDYLLKPFSEIRFRAALDRARREMLMQDKLELSHSRMLNILNSLGRTPEGLMPVRNPVVEPQFLQRFVVRDRDRFLIVKVDDVDWIESAANYVQLHAGKKCLLLRATMRTLESKLDPNQFVRIHRSTIVNISRIKQIKPEWDGDFEIMLDDETRLRMSRSYRSRLLTQ